ncbi:hypothetical protein ADL26_15260, partial [Thermoactinomyces vulgaris]
MELGGEDDGGLGAGAVLGDDRVGFARALGLVVVVGPVEQNHRVGILLDRAAFAQVRELRALVGAIGVLTVELGGDQDRAVHVLREDLQVAAELGDGDLAGLAFGGGHELEVVNDDQADLAAVAGGELADAGAQLGHGHLGGGVDVQGRLSDERTGVREAGEAFVSGAAFTLPPFRGGARLGGGEALGDLLAGHLKRGEEDRAAFTDGDVAGDVGQQDGLAHAGSAGHDVQTPGLEAAGNAVDVVEAGRQADRFAFGAEGLEGGREVVAEAQLGAVGVVDGVTELPVALFDNGVDAAVHGVGELADPGPGHVESAAAGMVGDDAGVVAAVRGGGDRGEEVVEVGAAADLH